ncbi:MAG: TraM recognition domain-containing protein [Tepidisphaeraceae bacterium]
MLNWFARGRRRAHPWDLDTELCRWASRTPWRIRDAVEGTLILGATGSGKTTATGRMLADAFLHAGFGGLILTTKPDERAMWERYCAATGRLDDLIVFSPANPYRFNFLNYELQCGGAGAGITHNLVNTLSEIAEVADRQSGGGGNEERFWQRAERQNHTNSISLQRLAQGRVSVGDLYRVIVSAPTSLDQVRSAEWRAESFCMQLILQASQRIQTDMDRAEFELVSDYYLLEWPQLSDKTRSVIQATVTSMLDTLNRGIIRELLSTTTSPEATPEACFDGKLILIDLPVKTFGDVGLFAQVIYKRMFQQAVERRRVEATSRPVMLFIDEAANFVTSSDLMFQTTCRSAKCATVWLSQSIQNFYARLGGTEKAKAEADGILANLNTKIVHALGDSVTTTWAAELIGKARTFHVSTNSTGHHADFLFNTMMGHAQQASGGANEVVDYEVQPSRFTTLRKGGPDHRFVADCILTQAGRRFEENGGRNWIWTSVRQRL